MPLIPTIGNKKVNTFGVLLLKQICDIFANIGGYVSFPFFLFENKTKTVYKIHFCFRNENFKSPELLIICGNTSTFTMR